MRGSSFIAIFMVMFCAVPAMAQEKLICQPAMKQVTLTGYTRAQSTVTITPEVAGKLQQVNYEVGQAIGKKPLFKIETTFIDLQLQTLEQSIKQLEIGQKRLESKIVLLQKDYMRMDKLFKGGSITDVQYDASAEELKQSRLELESVISQRRAAGIQLLEVKELLSRHTISAPEGWVMTQQFAEKGELVGPQMPIGKIADFRSLIVPFAISPEELSAIQNLGENLSGSLEGQPVKLTINWTNPEFNEQTRKLGCEIGIVDYSGDKRGGLRLELEIMIPSRGLQVPKAAVTARYANPRVTLAADGSAVPIMVLGESGANLLIADNPRLKVGTELKPAG